MTAVHGPWCNAVTWPTKCPGCKQAVFFFHCNHGSRVFFDELGPPWPIHDCETSWARKLKRRKDGGGGITAELSANVWVHRPSEGRIDQSVELNFRRRKQRPDPIVAMKPGNCTAADIVGVLRERKLAVDVVKALQLPTSQMSAMTSAFLGPLAHGKWGKVTVHQQSAHKDQLESYTVWVRQDNALDRAFKGVTVAMSISSLPIPGDDHQWICESLSVLG